MTKASEIIDEIKEREKKGFLKRLKREKKGKDSGSLKTYLQQLPFHIQNSLKIIGEYKYLKKIDRIIICGVGISYKAGRVLENYLGNIEVIQDNKLPENVNEKTMVFVVSFTGREQEPILCYRNALRKGCKIIGITSGGSLLESFKRNNVEHLVIPEIPETISLPYIFFMVLRYLENSNQVKNKANAIEETIKALKSPDYPSMAKKIAENCKDKTPIICSSKDLCGVSLHWKHQINRIAKHHAFFIELREMCHEGLDGFVTQKDKYHIIILRDNDEDKQTNKDFDIAKKIIKNNGLSVTELLIKGKHKLSRIFSTIFIGEVTAYYLSELYKTKDAKSLVENFRKDYEKTV
ncbi:MAG: SIS domain-containing protein [Nanobdellota archaeon]